MRSFTFCVKMFISSNKIKIQNYFVKHKSKSLKDSIFEIWANNNYRLILSNSRKEVDVYLKIKAFYYSEYKF